MEVVARLREAGPGAGSPVIVGPGSAVFTGNSEARAESGGIAIGQLSGGMHVSQGPPAPSQPGRSSH